MKTIYLMRHATAEPPRSGGDFERALAEQGRAEAERQGRRFAEWGRPLHRIVASAALRAHETAERFAAGQGGAPPLQFEEQLYNASGESLLQAVQGLLDDDDDVLIVAHMPGVGHLLSMLTTEHVDLALAFAPGTVCGVRLDAETWSDVDYGVGLLALFMPPLPV